MATTEHAEAAHVIVHGTAAGFAQRIEIGSHHLDADEPAAFGGTDTGSSPYARLLAALGSCTSITVGCYAPERRWPLANMGVSAPPSSIHALDCEACEATEGK